MHLGDVSSTIAHSYISSIMFANLTATLKQAELSAYQDLHPGEVIYPFCFKQVPKGAADDSTHPLHKLSVVYTILVLSCSN